MFRLIPAMRKSELPNWGRKPEIIRFRFSFHFSQSAGRKGRRRKKEKRKKDKKIEEAPHLLYFVAPASPKMTLSNFQTPDIRSAASATSAASAGWAAWAAGTAGTAAATTSPGEAAGWRPETPSLSPRNIVHRADKISKKIPYHNFNTLILLSAPKWSAHVCIYNFIYSIFFLLHFIHFLWRMVNVERAWMEVKRPFRSDFTTWILRKCFPLLFGCFHFQINITRIQKKCKKTRLGRTTTERRWLNNNKCREFSLENPRTIKWWSPAGFYWTTRADGGKRKTRQIPADYFLLITVVCVSNHFWNSWLKFSALILPPVSETSAVKFRDAASVAGTYTFKSGQKIVNFKLGYFFELKEMGSIEPSARWTNFLSISSNFLWWSWNGFKRFAISSWVIFLNWNK